MPVAPSPRRPDPAAEALHALVSRLATCLALLAASPDEGSSSGSARALAPDPPPPPARSRDGDDEAPDDAFARVRVRISASRSPTSRAAYRVSLAAEPGRGLAEDEDVAAFVASALRGHPAPAACRASNLEIVTATRGDGAHVRAYAWRALPRPDRAARPRRERVPKSHRGLLPAFLGASLAFEYDALDGALDDAPETTRERDAPDPVAAVLIDAARRLAEILPRGVSVSVAAPGAAEDVHQRSPPRVRPFSAAAAADEPGRRPRELVARGSSDDAQKGGGAGTSAARTTPWIARVAVTLERVRARTLDLEHREPGALGAGAGARGLGGRAFFLVNGAPASDDAARRAMGMCVWTKPAHFWDAFALPPIAPVEATSGESGDVAAFASEEDVVASGARGESENAEASAAAAAADAAAAAVVARVGADGEVLGEGSSEHAGGGLDANAHRRRAMYRVREIFVHLARRDVFSRADARSSSRLPASLFSSDGAPTPAATMRLVERALAAALWEAKRSDPVAFASPGETVKIATREKIAEAVIGIARRGASAEAEAFRRRATAATERGAPVDWEGAYAARLCATAFDDPRYEHGES